MNAFFLSFVKENFGTVFTVAILVAFILGGFLIYVTIKLGDLEPARKGFHGLKEKVDDIWDLFFGGKTIKTSSPITLTELGVVISRRINAKILAKQHLDKLKLDSGTSILDAFDIQTISMNFAIEKLPGLLSDKERKMVQEEAFNRGMKDLKNILQVVGVEMRNIWLKDAGIDISQLDNKDDQD